MNKNEKVFSSKDLKIKEVENKSRKYNKINKNLLQENSLKDINKNFKNKYFNKFTNKEKVKSHKQLNAIDRLSKNLETNNRNLHRIDITMNFNLTNFTTYNDTNKILDKKLIENYSGKKEIFHKRQISDGFQKIKVINTGNFVNIKVNTKENKTSTNKDIKNIKKMNNKSKIFKNNYINYDIEENDRINNTNNYIYNSHKDLYSHDKISKLKINVSDLSNKKNYQKLLEEKRLNKNNINLNNFNSTKSALNINKNKNEKMNNNNIPLDKNIFTKKIMINNKLFKYKTFKNLISESKKNIKSDISKRVLIANCLKEKINRIDASKNLVQSNNYDIILPNDKIELFPLNINKSINKKINKYKINNSCDGLNNNNKESNLYKKVAINLNNTSRNNTNRESTNFMTDKNKINEEDYNTVQNRDNFDNCPELNFFNIVKLIQKSKNSVT